MIEEQQKCFKQEITSENNKNYYTLKEEFNKSISDTQLEFQRQFQNFAEQLGKHFKSQISELSDQFNQQLQEQSSQIESSKNQQIACTVKIEKNESDLKKFMDFFKPSSISIHHKLVHLMIYMKTLHKIEISLTTNSKHLMN
ncbi:MAG: hypothetical protein HC930_08975 [Hydrococcus sp. SU_1_0]|nr:hypothetical protein [Hydrococcus sp. SU_1_0]